MAGNSDFDGWFVDEAGHGARWQYEFGEADPVGFAETLYAAWGELAARELPRKLQYLGVNQDDFPDVAAPAWMRPGIPLFRQRRAVMRELMAESAA